MLKPSKKVALAFEAVIDIAYHGGAEPVQSQDIARRLGLPRRYLEQVLQQLVRCGVLKGVRGPRGGYELARERRRITAADIVRAAMTATGEDNLPPLPESRLVDEVVGPAVREASEAFLAELEAYTVEMLCKQAEDGTVFGGMPSSADFAI